MARPFKDIPFFSMRLKKWVIEDAVYEMDMLFMAHSKRIEIGSSGYWPIRNITYV
jgi:hypothetical protein